MDYPPFTLKATALGKRQQELGHPLVPSSHCSIERGIQRTKGRQ